MAEDLRSRITKRLIIDCFVNLLEDTSISKITVKAICSEAEINRATFYRYYENPYDLLKNIEGCLLEQIRTLTANAINSNSDSNKFRESLKDLLAFFQNNRKTVLAISAHGEDNFPIKLQNNIFTFMVKSTPHLTHENLTDKENLWLYQYMASGMAAIVFSWLESDMEEPLGTVANFLLDCCEGIHSRILKR